jgi:hypothetical protein
MFNVLLHSCVDILHVVDWGTGHWKLVVCGSGELVGQARTDLTMNGINYHSLAH